MEGKRKTKMPLVKVENRTLCSVTETSKKEYANEHALIMVTEISSDN